MKGAKRTGDGGWRVRVVRQCPKTGKQIQRVRTLPAGATQDDVLRCRAELIDQATASERGPERAKRVRFSDYCAQWLLQKTERVRPHTAVHYAHVLDTHVLPDLGDLFLDGIDRMDVEAWVGRSERACGPNGERYTQSTVSGWFRVLTSVLRDACADYGLPDCTRRVNGPRVKGVAPKRQKDTLTRDELTRFLDASGRRPELVVLAWTGMRAGELAALRWEDVDLDRRQASVCRSWVRGHEDVTKTIDPRIVPLTAGVVEVLRAHRESMLREQHPGLATGRVFTSPSGGWWVYQSLQRRMERWSEGLSVRVTPQVLRRTFNTLMLEAGVDRVVLRSMMGHCSEELTQRYAGVGLESKLRAVEEVE